MNFRGVITILIIFFSIVVITSQVRVEATRVLSEDFARANHLAAYPLDSLSSSSSSYIQQLLHQSGVCYGRVSNNLPQPSDVLNLIKSNGITRIRLFKADPDALKPFSGIGIQLMIGVPNEALPSLANGIVN
ncbi:unnamed protein product [Ilex paraguariensis]|uniref:Glucan endo-1,3-beta-D-glucosidase n=1 Tax=Ilex paraguariensis TaxID=185542 RepID=A0ABC8U036_9AQUA